MEEITDPKPDAPAQGKAPIKEKAIVIALGLVFCLACLEAGLRVLGATLMLAQAHRNALAMRPQGAYRIMCIGESTTQGQYPPFLEQALNGRSMGIRFSVIDRGRIGTNSAALLSRLGADLDTYHPNMVVAMMGINDYGPHMLYEPGSISKIARFFTTLRTYKLTSIAWQHLARIGHEAGDVPYGSAAEILPLGHGLAATHDKAVSEDINTNGRLVGRMIRRLAELVGMKRKDRVYVELGWLYHEQGKPAEAAAAYTKALQINPRNDRAYVELGWLYQEQGKPAEAAAAYTKALQINPRNDRAYENLGWFYRLQGKSAEAAEALRKALEINPRNVEADAGLGWIYQEQGKAAQAEQIFKEIFKETLQTSPAKDRVYEELGQFYQAQGKYVEAEETLKKALEINPGDDRAYRELGWVYRDQGKPAAAAAVAEKAEAMRLKEYDPVVAGNYHRLQEILAKRGMQLVCVQYPMRSLAPLRKIFQGRDQGIIFVDNENVFKAAVKRSSLKEYFVDMFAGDFGHCTRKGNELLAKNIADVVWQEYFRK